MVEQKNEDNALVFDNMKTNNVFRFHQPLLFSSLETLNLFLRGWRQFLTLAKNSLSEG